MFSRLPITKKRSGGRFMEPLNSQPYYEDLYGKRNSDEFGEGSVHSCESEASEEKSGKASGRPARKPPSKRSSQKFASRKPLIASRPDRFGRIKTAGRQRLHAKASALDPPATTLPTPPNHRVSQHPTASEKLEPRKSGLLRKPARRMEAPNTAGDALNDLLGVDDLNDFEEEIIPLEPNDTDEFESGRKDTPTESTTARLLPNPYTPATRRSEAVGSGEVDESVLGDVEDNESEPEEAELEQKTPARGRRRPKGQSGGSILKNSRMRKPKQSLRRQMEKPVAAVSESGTLRRSGRVNQMQESLNLPRMRSRANTKAKQIASSNRSKMTTRAVVLRKRARAKQIVRPAEKEDYFEAVYGREEKVGEAIPQSTRPGTKKQATTKPAAVTDEEAKQNCFRAVYGRKSQGKADNILERDRWQPGYADVVPSAVAKAMEKVRGWAEVVVGEDEMDEDEYVRM